MQMQAVTRDILYLDKDASSSNMGAWVFTGVNDYPRIKEALIDGSFDELLPILATAMDAS